VSPFAACAISAGYEALSGLDYEVSSPKRPVWMMHGTNDQGVPYVMGQTFANDLTSAGWPVTFTTIQDAPHAWLWQAKYGHSNDELWMWFEAHPAR
jgi:predicted esterase